ncbi:MAG: SprT family zinc-dependent metalloprotease [Pseudomonadota bacterium]
MPIKLRRHPGARRFVLRVSGGTIHLTIPTRARQSAALQWLEQQSDFVERELCGMPEPVPFALGAALPVLGRMRRIETGGPRGGALLPDVIVLHVTEPERVPAATERVIRRAVQEACEGEIKPLWRELDVEDAPIGIRQMRRRWGSCAIDGSTVFNWRLAFAPPAVLSYVIAHEAAHRIEMNHGPRFWNLVWEICPDYQQQSQWLKDNGESLFVYGAT